MRRITPASGRSILAAAAAAILFLLLCSLPARAGAAWTLDGFGIRPGGSAAINGVVHAVAVQRQDAKILVAGEFTLTGGIPAVTRTNLARLNHDGTLDASFDPPAPAGPVYALALQPDPVAPGNPDYIWIGGSFTDVGGTNRKGLARLAGGTGTLDPLDPVTTPLAVTVLALDLLPAGAGLLVGGEFRELKAGLPTRNLAGVAVAGGAAGTLNWTYTGGLNDDAGNVAVNAIALQDGAVVVGGEFVTPWSANLARFSASGVYDAGFRPTSPNAAVRALAVQADGKILFGGEFSGAFLSRNYLARLNRDGTLDAFDPGFASAAGAGVLALVVEPDGAIIAAGTFSAGAGPTQRWNLARLRIDGTLSETVFPPPDGAVRALARQGDGCLLAAGAFGNVGSVTRTSLARFYPYGALDDDLPQVVDDGGLVNRLSLHPDGRTTVTGLFEQVLGAGRFHIARLRGDWSIDPGYDPNLNLGQQAFTLVPLPDDALLMGGDFITINGDLQVQMVRIDGAGVPGPASFNSVLGGYLQFFGYINALTVAGDGTIYLGGDNVDVSPYRFMSRLFGTGVHDPGFVPPGEVDGVVTAIAIQPDGLLLVTTDTGKVLRLLPGGSLDPAWHGGTPLQLGGKIDHLVLLPDGRILVSGYTLRPGSVVEAGSGATVAVSRNLVRISGNGIVDDGFVIEALYTHDGSFDDHVLGVTVQTDGSLIIYGVFDQIRDGFGTVIQRDYVTRVTPEGRLDPALDLGPFSFAGGTPVSQVETVNLQPDGKMLVGGDFIGLNGRNKLVRFSNGWSSEELSVSDTGDKVTWLRSGTSPELWRVTFEYSENPDAAVPIWVPLGNARWVAGRWELDGLDLAQFGTSVNRYVRARGYVASERGTLGSPVESVRLYYLKPQTITITVSADAQSKVYGQDDPPLTYTFTPALNGGDQFTGALSRIPGRDVGVYAITAGTLALGSGYQLVYRGANLTITQADLLITAADQTKTAGSANPPLSARYTGLAPWDTKDTLGGAPLISTAVDAATGRGSYPIHAALGGITSANYRYSFADGTFTVTGRPQLITFNQPPAKSYGDAPFAAAARADSGLPVGYASSNPGAATVVNGEIRIAGAGSTVITATQGGDAMWDPAPEVRVTLDVGRAALRMTAQDKSRAYLTPNPELTVNFLGFVYGEGSSVLTGTPLLSTAATLTSAVGSYPIVAAAGTLRAANYDIVPVNGTLTVFKSCQEITFPVIPERTFGDPPFEIVASACSGLPLSFKSSNPEVARVDGNVITVVGAGSAVITAGQPGSGDLETAPEQSQPFVVHRSGQQVSFSSPAQRVVGDPPFDLKGSASSGLPLSYASSDPAVATVAGSTVTVVGAGTTVLSALQGGSGNYLPALPVSRTLTVAQEGTPPQLQLSTLNSGATTANPVLNIMGRARDASGIASLTVAGVERRADAALFSAAVPLAEGENAVAVTARDGAGNVTTHSFTVTLDALAPVLTLSAPADNSVTDAVSCAVTGTVTPGSTVTMAVNGAALQFLPVSGGSFTGSALLAQGVNTIELTAERDGRSSRSKRSVTCDPAAPALAITDPVQDLRTEAESVTVRGTVGSAAAGGVQLEAAGALYTPEVVGGAFRQQLPLAPGENRVTVRAVSGSGTASLAQRNLVRIERIGGDLDGNGSVDIQDALQLLKISLGTQPAGAAALAHGDLAPVVNGVSRPDGVIDVGDLLVLLRSIVGLSHL
ncbi:hypothetical protein M1B72_06565 [Geomonas paludis]|uniref:MBG domain-containing protein n=1 Tax=Geomonas paludis TaxID=2740185 RepID=A0A6V8MV60_9BACT|nr:MBG domain-containing protein [Geomonas paludis]UPU37363.1 hypothetical protein M1B72_06565 [Geomonas paludis]GFO64075.1 hypothetical protein GMPD_19940 [Geomonas paludis]